MGSLIDYLTDHKGDIVFIQCTANYLSDTINVRTICQYIYTGIEAVNLNGISLTIFNITV